MSDEQNQQPQQTNHPPQPPTNDFFSDLMFGRPPIQPQSSESREASQQHEHPQSPESNDQSASDSNNQQGDQLTHIIALVQSLSPYLVKLAPLASKVSTLFNNEDDTDTTSSKNKSKKSND
ncbi:hypothetical protein N0O92_05215 [Alkalihalobacillus sp. MEB130]|uniref:hypothetical protein n=1 Tax=Alkalihalobacillus sp. MEB130 TaxID=2976704 RepID=UPI0028DFE16D|nr:hypothetical protein [Alkalihalobacillus sp. MEB130]MDT8859626.1 hypothetical protein [Alkalihalobacillus sp. MEB130]